MSNAEPGTKLGTIAGHDLDWRAVYAGALAQGVYTFVVFVLSTPIELFALGWVVSATVAALLSRNYRDEAIDGGIAAALGAAVSFLAIIAGVFFSFRSAPLGLRLDFSVVLGVYAALIVGVVGALTGLFGAVVAYVVAKYRERWRLHKEYS